MSVRVETVRLSNLQHRLLYWPGPASSPAFLLLHGWLDQASSLAEMAEQLCVHGPVLALDFRGHGHSDWIGPGGYYHFFDYLRDVEQLLEDPRLAAPVWLVGHSMGGSVATLVAGALPARVRGLVLLEGSGPPARPASAALPRAQRWLRELRRFGSGPRYEQTLEQLQTKVAALHPEFGPELLARFTQDGAIYQAGEGWRWRYDPLHRCTNPLPFQQEVYTTFAGAYPGPVLQVYGERSPMARLDDAQVAARESSFPGPRTRKGIADAGHMMHLTHPAHCARLIAAWIDGCSA